MPPDQRQEARRWLARAHGSLVLARQPRPASAFWADLCYLAQQAAEPANWEKARQAEAIHFHVSPSLVPRCTTTPVQHACPHSSQTCKGREWIWWCGELEGMANPHAFLTRSHSDRFVVRVPEEVHRRLAIQAAESGVSLDRLASARLNRQYPC